MVPTPNDPVATLVFFLLVFTVLGVVFLFAHLMMGSFIRPNKPDAEKLTIYECGEPTVGSAWIQFDLRFYVVALLFVIFDVEVAFFFPWATVFGKANQLANLPVEERPMDQLSASEKAHVAVVEAKRKKLSEELLPSGVSKATNERLRLTKKNESTNEQEVVPIRPAEAATWAQIVFWDIIVFFGVLMVGFAYVWRRGDINWVRAYAHHEEPTLAPENPVEQEKVSV